MLETFTNFNILVNLGCCEPGDGVTKTDTSDEMTMEDGYSDENASTSKMTTRSREILTSLPYVLVKKKTHKIIEGISWQTNELIGHHLTEHKKEYRSKRNIFRSST